MPLAWIFFGMGIHAFMHGIVNDEPVQLLLACVYLILGILCTAVTITSRRD